MQAGESGVVIEATCGQIQKWIERRDETLKAERKATEARVKAYRAKRKGKDNQAITKALLKYLKKRLANDNGDLPLLGPRHTVADKIAYQWVLEIMGGSVQHLKLALERSEGLLSQTLELKPQESERSAPLVDMSEILQHGEIIDITERLGQLALESQIEETVS